MVGVPTPGGVARPVDVAEAEPGRLGIIEEDLPPGRSIGRGGEGDGAILSPRGVEAALRDEVRALGAFGFGIPINKNKSAWFYGKAMPGRDGGVSRQLYDAAPSGGVAG